MNKIYFILMVCSLALLASCEEDGTEVVNMTYQDTSITTAGITPTQGYIGEQITITGTGFGTSIEFLKVYFGDFPGEMVACSDEKVLVKVPEEAVTSKMIVEFLGKKMATDLTFTVLDNPVLTVISSLTVYAGDEITITGTGMPEKADNLVVMLEDTKAEISSYTVDENDNVTLKAIISKKQLAGSSNLIVKLFDREILRKKFNVLASPEVNVYGNRFVRAGSELVITGTGFRDFVDKVKIDFGGTVVGPVKVTDTAITVQLPAGFTSGATSVTLGDFAPVELGELQVLSAGDITDKVLKNSVQPFKPIDGYVAGTEWTNPADWIMEYTGNALQFPADTPGGLLVFGAKNQDSKVYQVMALPKGKYKITLDIEGGTTDTGRRGVIFTVAKGKATIPNIEDKKPWYFINDTDVLAYYRITDKVVKNKDSDKEEIGKHQHVVDLSLDKDTELTIGFVIQLLNGNTVKLSSIRMSME